MPAIVAQTSISDTTGGALTTASSGFGPLNAQIGWTAGNWLIAFLACGTNNPQTYLPRLSIADDAHNWWIYCGSASSLFPGASRRLDIWVAPNVRSNYPGTFNNICVGASGIYDGIAGLITEVSGMPTYANVDFFTTGGGFGTSTTLTATATTADYVFGAELLSKVGSLTSPTMTYPAGWTALTVVNNGSTITDNSSQILYPAWDTVSAGAVSATFSWSGSLNNLAAMVGFKQTASGPSQPNAHWPSLKVEAAFGFQPGNLSGTMPTWTDITTRAQDSQGGALLAAKAGRDYELSSPAAGELSLTLDNHDGAFNPSNSSSPFFPNVLPECPIRLSATWNGITYGLGYYYANKWPQNFPNPQWGMSEVEGTDAIGMASQGQMPSAYGGQVLADGPYSYYPLSDYYAQPHFALFANLSRTNLKPAVGFSQGGSTALLSTGQTLGLAGDGATGIGTSGLSQPTTADAGCGAFVRDYALPDLGVSTVTLELWAEVPVVSGKTGTMQLAALTSQPWNYPPSLSAGIAAGSVLSVTYKTNGGSGSDVISVYMVDENAAVIQLTPINVTAGQLCHMVFEVSYNSGLSEYTIAGWINGVSAGSATSLPGAGPSTVPVYGMHLGSCQPFSGLATTANYVLGQVAYYSWGLTAQRILSHYNTGATADSGDPVITRVGKLAAWSGLGLPVLGAAASPSPLIGNADQVQGSALVDALYALTVDEGGMFYAHGDSVGSLWYATRTSLYNRAPRFTFGDNPSLSEIPYEPGSGFDFSDAFLFNIISSQRTISASQQLFIGSGGQAESAQFNSYGVTAVAADTASEAEYMPRGPMQLPIETTSDQDAYDRTNWSLTKYKQPVLRANQIQLNPAANPSVWPAALGVQQGDIVTVNRRPLGAVPISLNCIVQQVAHNIGPGVWTTTLTLAPYFPDNAVIQLDNTSFNQLQDGALGW